MSEVINPFTASDAAKELDRNNLQDYTWEEIITSKDYINAINSSKMDLMFRIMGAYAADIVYDSNDTDFYNKIEKFVSELVKAEGSKKECFRDFLRI